MAVGLSPKRKTKKRKNTRNEVNQTRRSTRAKTKSIDDIDPQVAHPVNETPATAGEDQGLTLQTVMSAEKISVIRKTHLDDIDGQGLEVSQVMKANATTLLAVAIAPPTPVPLPSLITTADQLF